MLGANDGLVSNLSLVMGVAGAAIAGSAILITGLAGLLAGAISMALGEWLSVQSSRELYKHQIGMEERRSPAIRGGDRGAGPDLPGARAETRAAPHGDQDHAGPRTPAKPWRVKNLAWTPRIGGSAWEAAITVFVLFAIGAIIPAIPYFFLSGIRR